MVENLNRQRVLNLLDPFYAGDIEGALARCSDDVELFAPAPIDILPHMGRHRGKDEVRKTWQTVHTPLFAAAPRGARHRCRRRQGRGQHPRVLHQARQRPHRAVRHRGVLHAARGPHHPASARSWIRSTWCSRCSSATRLLTGKGRWSRACERRVRRACPNEIAHALNLTGPCRDPSREFAGRTDLMKIALLACWG